LWGAADRATLGNMATEPVVIEFELTPEDWVEVSMHHSEKSPQIQGAMRNVRILFGALIVLAALISLLDGGTTGAMIWLIAGAVVMAVMTPTLRAGRRRQVKQYAESGIANGMFGPHRVELRPDGMVDRTNGYEWLTYWSSIERVEEGDGSFLIYTGTNALLPIPHTAFPDAASLRRFSEAFYSLREAERARRLTGTPPGGIVSKPEPEGT
jgi:hypothetical protein